MEELEYASRVPIGRYTFALHKYLEKPIEVPLWPQFTKISEPSEVDILGVDWHSHFLDRVFGPISFNPNDNDRLRAMRKLYVELSPSGNERRLTLPSSEGMENLLVFVKSASTNTILIVGNRGVGKSMAINYFLSKNFAHLNRDCRTTFFRADVVKLNAINGQRHLAKKPRITIREFMEAHAYYVALRWHKEDALLNGFQFDIQNPGQCNFSRWLAENAVPTSRKILVEMWEKIVDRFSILDSTRTPGDSFSVDIFEGILNKDAQKARDLHRYFMQFVRLPINGEFGRVIKIIDGVDNLRKGNDDGEYEHLLKDLIHFRASGSEKSLHDYDVSIIALRTDTDKELDGLRKALKLEFRTDLEHRFQVLPPAVSELLKRKRDYAQSDSLDEKYLFSILGDGLSNRDRDRLRRFESAIDYLLRRLGRVGHINKSRENIGGAHDGAVAKVFNNNFRSLSRNVVRAAAYYERFQQVHGTTVPIAENIWLEGSVLGGQETFPSNEDDRQKGRWCPNVFEFTPASEGGKWGGLTITRIVQLLSQGRNFSAEKIQSALHYVLGYPEVLIEEAFETCREFGLIEVATTEIQSAAKISGPQRIQVPTYTATEKGRFVIWLANSNLPVMYLMSLTVPFIKKEILPNKFLVWKHLFFDEISTSETKNRKFKEAAIRTAALLVRHIHTVHSQEMARPAPQDLEALLEIHSQRETFFPLPIEKNYHRMSLRYFSDQWTRPAGKVAMEEQIDQWTAVVS